MTVIDLAPRLRGDRVAALVEDFRSAATGIRRMNNVPRTGRNSAATLALATRRTDEMDAAVRALLQEGERQMVGLLTDEHHVATRLQQARRYSQDRPELRRRLAAVRREIKTALESL